jgi:serine protease inhibitor
MLKEIKEKVKKQLLRDKVYIDCRCSEELYEKLLTEEEKNYLEEKELTVLDVIDMVLPETFKHKVELYMYDEEIYFITFNKKKDAIDAINSWYDDRKRKRALYVLKQYKTR